MNQVINEIQMMGIVPVIKLDDPKDAKPLAKALVDGGLACAEVTFRTEAAEEAIAIMRGEYPQMIIGAGTVLTTEQVDLAVAAGASFIVSPGLNPRVVKYCLEKDLPIIPGCSSPSDIELAMELGLDVVKFFPAQAAGGLDMIKAMAAPYSNMKFMPTGGINTNNLMSYLDFHKVLACGGSWMVKDSYIKAGDFHKISSLTKEAVDLMLGMEIDHITITKDDKETIRFGLDFELVNMVGKNKDNSIIYKTNNIKRACYHLRSRGYVFSKEDISYDQDGDIELVYLKNKIGDFKIGISQK